MNHEPSAISKAIATVFGLAAAIFSTWTTIIAFVGGTMPVIGWKTDGGLGTGLLWLFIVDPIMIGVFRIVAVVLSMPFSIDRTSGRS